MWRKVLGLKALENNNGSVSIRVNSDEIIFIAKVNNRLYAMNGVCSHLKCILGNISEDKKHVICPCHNAEFELDTGKMVAPPFIAKDAPMDKLGLKIYSVREENGFIELDLN